MADIWDEVNAEARATIRTLTGVVWGLTVLAIVLFVAGVLLWGAYWRLRNTLDMDCGGVLARLDLTEMVEVCREAVR